MSRFTSNYTRVRIVFVTTLLASTAAAGCGSASQKSMFEGGPVEGANSGTSGGSTDGTSVDENNGDLEFGGDGGRAPRPCEGLECRQVSCENGGTTSLSGVVFDPSGTVPLYNAIVYVPNAPVDPFDSGTVTCDRCGTVPSGKPIATALTDAAGRFTLTNVPVGENVPLVIQIGKWRRQVTVQSVAKCTNTPLEAGVTRLPRTKAEGDIPKIAVTTGAADSLECFFRKLLGESAEEITNPDGTGRVHVYKGVRRREYTQKCTQSTGGGKCVKWKNQNCTPQADQCRTVYVTEDGARVNDSTPDATELWGSASGGEVQSGKPNEFSWPARESKLMKYDMVILSCEGAENNLTKDDLARKNLAAYLDAGGRVFASHFHYTWIKNKPNTSSDWPLSTTATWEDNEEVGDRTVRVDTSFAKGEAFADWLMNVGASAAPPTGKGRTYVDMKELRRNVTAVTPETSRQWVYETANDDGSGDYTSTKYYSFNAPVGASPENQCGRGVYTDIHVSSGDTSGGTFPANCSTSGFTAQEKALLFLMMDLSACIQDDSKPPAPPPPKIN